MILRILLILSFGASLASAAGCVEKRLFSHHNRYYDNDVGFQIVSMELLAEYSVDSCKYGDGFGFTGSRAFVAKGCRADFKICDKLPDSCPVDWEHFKQGSYETCLKHIKPGAMTWFDARSKCQALGGDLLSSIEHGIADYVKDNMGDRYSWVGQVGYSWFEEREGRALSAGGRRQCGYVYKYNDGLQDPRGCCCTTQYPKAICQHPLVNASGHAVQSLPLPSAINGQCSVAPEQPELYVSNANPVDGEMVTFECKVKGSDWWYWKLFKDGSKVYGTAYGKRENGVYVYKHQIKWSPAAEGSYTCKYAFTCYPWSEASNSIECQTGEVIERIKVEVSGQKNSESLDAECAIAFAGGVDSATFTSPGGEVFPRGQNKSFGISGLASGIMSGGLTLKCESSTNDALNVDKLHVFTNSNQYVGDVRSVFDDASSCNTAYIYNRKDCSAPKTAAKCCYDEVLLSMVSVP